MKNKIGKYLLAAGITSLILTLLIVIVFILYTAGGYVISGMKVVSDEMLSYILARFYIQDKDTVPEKYKIDPNATIEERAIALSKSLHSYRLAFKSLEIMADAADVLEKKEMDIKEQKKVAQELKAEIKMIQDAHKNYESTIKFVEHSLSTVMERKERESFWPGMLQSLFFTALGLVAGELIHFIKRKIVLNYSKK